MDREPDAQYQELTQLTRDIYDAALDAARWADVLAKIADFVGGQAGGLVTRDSVGKSGNTCHQFGIDPHYMRLYAETYWEFDPLAMLSYCDLEEIASIPDLVPYNEFRAGRFYQEWARPQRWVDVASAVLEKSVTSCASLSVIRSETSGMVDGEMRRRMGLVVPHVRRAVLIGNVIDLGQAEAATFADILDGLRAGIVLIDAGGRVVHANAAGRGILDTDDFLRAAVDGRLVANDAQVDQALREVFATAAGGDTALGIKGIALPLTARNGDAHVVHVLPLTSGERRRVGVTSTAVAALFIRKAEMETPSPLEVIARTYKLTPTELRVLLAIVEVGSGPEAAKALGVADSTIKAHLSSLFEKTGAGRQADLVKLVAGFSSPLIG